MRRKPLTGPALFMSLLSIELGLVNGYASRQINCPITYSPTFNFFINIVCVGE